jgi:zinc transport system substrate-binding protein
MVKTKTIFLLALCSVSFDVGVSSGDTPAAGAKPIAAAASISPLAALVREVGGDLVDVETLLPPGASPHGYEPQPGVVRSLATAEVEFVIGRGLDGWAESIARGANPNIRIVRVGTDLPGPEPPSDPSDREGDPHVWCDPVKAEAIARRIGEALASLRPDEADRLRARAEDEVGRIAVIDSICAARLTPLRDVPFASLHGGLLHMVARYRLNQVALLQPFGEREPTPRYLKDVVDTIRKTGARAIFTEPQVSPQLAQVVGKETGIPVVQVDAIGGIPGRMSYSELILFDVDVIARTLGGGTK